MSNIDASAEAPTKQRAVLIVAHPGHELLLHHWLERAQPIVCALTDGSGGHAQSRSGRSKAIIRRAGAHVGPVFAAATDREWYRAILEGDRRLFDAAAGQISETCCAQGVTQIVADALEFINPMHNLCSCLAQNVSMQLAPEEPFYEKFGRDMVKRSTYAELITYADHVRPLAAMLTRGGALPPLAVTAS